MLRRDGWEGILNRNSWFDREASLWLNTYLRRTEEKPAVFSYSYAARDTFLVAKGHGCHTILGQIDPGPVEMRLVESLCRKSARSPQIAPPSRYWKGWSEECELADDIVVNSEWSRTALLEEGVPGEKIHVIPLVYQPEFTDVRNWDRYPESFSEKRPLKVLFLGQVNLRKGVVELLEAIRLMEGRPIEWTIVGSGDNGLLNELRSLPGTIVTGAVSRAETRHYYESADLFILPTHSDGFALTQLEACAFGLPIIASRNCGEVVEHRHNGMLLDEVTGPAIVRALKEFLEHPGLIRQYSLNQRFRTPRRLEDLGADLIDLRAVQPMGARTG